MWSVDGRRNGGGVKEAGIFRDKDIKWFIFFSNRVRRMNIPSSGPVPFSLRGSTGIFSCTNWLDFFYSRFQNAERLRAQLAQASGRVGYRG